jgi:hypothetical protein
MAKWDGTAWSEMGGGLFYPANVYGAHTFCLYGQDLIVGGLFSSAGSVPAAHIAVWNEPVIPVTLNIQNDIIANGTSTCYNATQTITVAGGATSFVVLNGGSATMIAGQNIIFLPGTKVDSGGYLSGYITTNGQYCGVPAAPALMGLSDGNHESVGRSARSRFNVYPNPSAGQFFLELPADMPGPAVRAEIYDSRGARVSVFSMNHEKVHPFTLSDHPAGIYHVRLITPTTVETALIVKRD